jgi:nitrite reductase/ring-hydroxylating ferredoxin subunit
MAAHLQDGRHRGVSRQLCRLDEIPEGSARGFRLGSGTDLLSVLVLRRDGIVRAYENACPHMGTPLNFLPDRFFDRDGRHLLCATHGALFRIEDGYCLSGPCLGKSLRPLAVSIEHGAVMLADDAS